MRVSHQFLAITALAVPLVSAQSIADLPACALKAATSSIASTGCSPTNYACLCKATSFLTALQGQVSTSCSAEDYATTIGFAQKACSSVGITLSMPGSSAASAETPATATGAETPNMATSGASAGEATDSASIYGSSSVTSAPMATTTGTSGNSTNGTIAGSQPVVPFEGLAASLRFQVASAALLVGTVVAFVAL